MKKRKAQWIRKTHIFRKDEYICSVCSFIAQSSLPVCPKCGSTMKNCKYDPTWVDEIEMLDIIDGD